MARTSLKYFMTCLIALVGINAIALVGINSFFPYKSQQPSPAPAPAHMAPVAENVSDPAPPPQTKPSPKVFMYSLSTCVPCKIMEKQMTEAGIPFADYVIDKEPERGAQLSERLREAGMPSEHVGVPVLFAGDRVFLGVTPISEIKSAIQ